MCEAENSDKIPMFDILEMLMYSRRYGMNSPMKNKFQQISSEILERINNSDYSSAEKVCPQKMAIGQLMKEAYDQISK